MGKMYKSKTVQKVEVVKHKSRRRKGVATIVRSLRLGSKAPLGDRLKMKFNYGETLSFVTGASGVISTRQFNMNSLFDVDRTFTGHQPYGFDQVSAFYNRYIVTKCIIKMKIIGLTTTEPVVFTGYGLNATSGAATQSAAIETPNAKTKLLNYYSGTESYTHTFDLAKFTGQSMTSYKGDDRYEALVGASPGELMVYNISVSNPNGALSGVVYVIEVIQHAEFFDPLQLAQS